jgi:hypothetical protein
MPLIQSEMQCRIKIVNGAKENLLLNLTDNSVTWPFDFSFIL